MEYVMVPVPEEYVAEVAQYLQWNTGEVPPDLWELDSVIRFLDGLDEQARTLLLHAAKCADDIVVLPVTEAAKVLGRSERETLGTLIELNDAARVAGGPLFVLATAVLHETTETGPKAWSVNMPGPLARLLVEASEERLRRQAR